MPFHVSVDVLVCLREARSRDEKLRDEALRAAKSVCCNIAVVAGRISKADKARAFTIARGEALEAFAALEVAAITSEANAEDVARCHTLVHRLYALLTGLIR